MKSVCCLQIVHALQPCEYSKCGQNGHAGKMAPSVDILAGRVILKCNYTEMTAVQNDKHRNVPSGFGDKTQTTA